MKPFALTTKNKQTSKKTVPRDVMTYRKENSDICPLTNINWAPHAGGHLHP